LRKCTSSPLRARRRGIASTPIQRRLQEPDRVGFQGGVLGEILERQLAEVVLTTSNHPPPSYISAETLAKARLEAIESETVEEVKVEPVAAS
jgi:hypothetical protein